VPVHRDLIVGIKVISIKMLSISLFGIALGNRTFVHGKGQKELV
jgi:hypothetical protein